MKQEMISLICQQYQNGSNSEVLPRIFKLSSSTILRILKKNNIIIRHYSETKFIKNNYFEQINTATQAYFLGLLYADGNVNRAGTQFKLGLKEPDDHILIELGREIFPNFSMNQIKTRKNNFKELYICSPILAKNLITLGCMPNKTYHIRFPFEHLDELLYSHFVRGYLDGDGCISEKIPKVDFTSNIKFLEDLKNIIGQHGFKSNKIHPIKRNPLIGYLQITGKNNVINFLSWIYQGSDDSMRLTRKFNKFQSLLNNN